MAALNSLRRRVGIVNAVEILVGLGKGRCRAYRLGSKTPCLLKTSATMGTVELTGLLLLGLNGISVFIYEVFFYTIIMKSQWSVQDIYLREFLPIRSHAPQDRVLIGFRFFFPCRH